MKQCLARPSVVSGGSDTCHSIMVIAVSKRSCIVVGRGTQQDFSPSKGLSSSFPATEIVGLAQLSKAFVDRLEEKRPFFLRVCNLPTTGFFTFQGRRRQLGTGEVGMAFNIMDALI